MIVPLVVLVLMNARLKRFLKAQFTKLILKSAQIVELALMFVRLKQFTLSKQLLLALIKKALCSSQRAFFYISSTNLQEDSDLNQFFQ